MYKTKLANKTMTNVTLKTSVKMAVSRQVNGALVEGTVAAPLVEKAVDRGLNPLLPEKNSSVKENSSKVFITGGLNE